MNSMQQQINNCKTLNELADKLNEFSELQSDYEQQEYKNIDLSNLPTFGGVEPEDTDGIFSWDESSYLVADNDWEIVAREEYEAE